MRPAGGEGEAAWASNVPGRTSRSANSVRMGSGLHGEKRERVGFEDRLLLLYRQRQGQELIDVLPQIFDARAGPVGAPEDAVRDLRQAGEAYRGPCAPESRSVHP